MIVSRFLTPTVEDPRAFVEAEVPLEQLTEVKTSDAADTAVNLPKIGRP